MRIIGITGGVGAGKSTVLTFLKEKYHAFVIQADEVGHKTIDRKYISDVVFGKPDMLAQLNRIIHPAVKRYILKILEEQKAEGCRLCIVEAALLLEEHYEEFCDEVWYIHTDLEIRIDRLIKSRGYTREKALGIIENQATEEFFRSHTDYVVENNGDLKQTWKQIEEGVRRNETL